MTKKELGKLRYDRHYAHVKRKLLKKYGTKPSDIKPGDEMKRPYIIFDEALLFWQLSQPIKYQP